ncbi:MAG: hypothetical protein ACQKBW_10240 [Puniceicoccales bacterium]
MRASYLLLFSAGLGLASFAGYLYLDSLDETTTEDTPSEAETPIAGDWEATAEFVPEIVQSDTVGKFNQLLDLEVGTLNEIEQDLDGKPAQPKPKSEPDATPAAPDKDTPPAPEQPAPTTPQPESIPAATDTAPDLSLAVLKAARTNTQPLTVRTVLHGKTYPYRVLIPAGWRILYNTGEVSALAYQEGIYVLIETGPWSTTQEDWARKSLASLLARQPDLQLAGDDTLEIDDRPWQQLYLRQPTSVLADPQEAMLLTYGARKHGSYRIILTGPADSLDRHVQALNQIIGTWHFPPDNFMPENASSVRIYVDGKQHY